MMDITYSDVIKIALSFILGALLGLEREYHSKPAGFRTMIMITLGSTMFTILSFRIGIANPDRLAANIITGIGFIGAGVIFKEGLKVGGLTTAATIWIAAAIGMAVGYGAYYLAGGVAGVVLITLAILSKLEASMDKFHQVKLYKISYQSNDFSVTELERELLKLRVRYKKYKEMKDHQEITQYYKIDANQVAFDALNNFLISCDKITGFEV